MDPKILSRILEGLLIAALAALGSGFVAVRINEVKTDALHLHISGIQVSLKDLTSEVKSLTVSLAVARSEFQHSEEAGEERLKSLESLRDWNRSLRDRLEEHKKINHPPPLGTRKVQ